MFQIEAIERQRKAGADGIEDLPELRRKALLVVEVEGEKGVFLLVFPDKDLALARMPNRAALSRQGAMRGLFSKEGL